MKTGYFNTGFIFLRCKILPDINQNDITTARKNYKMLKQIFFIFFFLNGPSQAQIHVWTMQGGATEEENDRGAGGYPGWRRGGSGGGGAAVAVVPAAVLLLSLFFFFSFSFLCVSVFRFLLYFFLSLLCLLSSLLSLLPLLPLFPPSFSFPFPCFYRQKQGGTSRWGGHYWPPPPLSISGEKGGKWAPNGGCLIA